MSRLILVVLCATACVTPAPPQPKPAPPADPVEQVRGLLTAAYTAVLHGDAESLAPLLTEEALVFGLGPTDTYTQREPFLARLAPMLLPLGMGADQLTLTESSPVVGLAAGERSGWVFDFPKVTHLHKGERSTWLPRVTAHVVRAQAGWQIDALHVSLPVPDTQVYAPDAPQRLLPPADVTNVRGPGTEELVGLTKRLLDDFEVKLERATDRPQFVLIGSSLTEAFEDGAHFKELTRPALPAIRKEGYSWKLDGSLRAELAPDGHSGWAAGNVVLRIGSGKKQKTLPAFRTLWVFIEEHGVWNLAVEHQSLALKEDRREAASDDEVTQWTEARKQARPQASPRAAVRDGGSADPGIGAW